jgi:hypothetical protein
VKTSKRQVKQQVIQHLQYTLEHKLKERGEFINFPRNIWDCLSMIREYRWWKFKMFFFKFLLLVGASLLIAGISTKVAGGIPILAYLELGAGILLCLVSGMCIYDLLKGESMISEEWIPGTTAYKLVREWKAFLGQAQKLDIIDKMTETTADGIQAYFDQFIPHMLKQSAISVRRFEIDGKPEKKKPLREYMSKLYEFGKAYNVTLPRFEEFFVN